MDSLIHAAAVFVLVFAGLVASFFAVRRALTTVTVERDASTDADGRRVFITRTTKTAPWGTVTEVRESVWTASAKGQDAQDPQAGPASNS